MTGCEAVVHLDDRLRTEPCTILNMYNSGAAITRFFHLQAGVITDIVLLSTVGIRCVLVHGGGPEINSWLEKVGIK